VLQAHDPNPVLKQLKQQFDVMSVMPPLLLVLLMSAPQLRHLHQMDGIEFIFLHEQIPTEFLDSLSERYFCPERL
jgi:hypothetical protein